MRPVSTRTTTFRTRKQQQEDSTRRTPTRHMLVQQSCTMLQPKDLCLEARGSSWPHVLHDPVLIGVKAFSDASMGVSEARLSENSALAAPAAHKVNTQ